MREKGQELQRSKAAGFPDVDLEIAQIVKRDGRIVPFEQDKITKAIYKSLKANDIDDKALSEEISDKVIIRIRKNFGIERIPQVEQIQDMVEETLMEGGLTKVAKSYILYREEHRKLREKILKGEDEDLELTANAIQVLERRYLLRDEAGKIVESPAGAFRRVAKNIAQAEAIYGNEANQKDLEKKFYQMISRLEFMPNSPTLMNAGKALQQLSACFVIPIEDDMTSIFDAVKSAALIHQSGGGTGFSFNRLRPKGDMVKSTRGVASGPLTFMRVFDTTTDVVKQGGTRRGANMGILNVDHPDVLDFIVCKKEEGKFSNFNISIALTEEFMKAVENDEDYDLVNPRTKEIARKLNARRVFKLITLMAWRNGEPGIIFIDRINRDNPTPSIGRIESTNPCGEQPLLPNEACNLGSINLSKFVKGKKVDYERLKDIVHLSVRFLDNVIDMSRFPLPQIHQTVKSNRKIGLGVMGFAEMLVKLGVKYDSEEALVVADEVMGFICRESKNASEALAKERGNFPNWSKSVYGEQQRPMRNATTTTIAPTGSISIISGCSSGVEPFFAISFVRRILDDDELLEVNKLFEQYATEQGFYSDALMRRIAKTGSVQKFSEVPDKAKKLFVTALDISPEWHIRMQAAFQKHIDNAVSKTVNFPFEATPEEVENAYLLAHSLGCKGLTIYRDRSRDKQVLNIDNRDKAKEEEMVKVAIDYAGGCEDCDSL